MVWKIIKCCVICVVLVSCIATQALAATHTIYDNGTLSTTYVQYFKDIIAGTNIKDNYVAFRSGQYSYTLVVGDLEYNNGVISLNDTGKIYEYRQEGNYNGTQQYYVEEINNFSINTGNNIIYSDVGDFPLLVERGSQFEVISTIMLGIVMLSFVISRIFNKR